jgi:hypothetical protein
VKHATEQTRVACSDPRRELPIGLEKSKGVTHPSPLHSAGQKWRYLAALGELDKASEAVVAVENQTVPRGAACRRRAQIEQQAAEETEKGDCSSIRPARWQISPLIARRDSVAPVACCSNLLASVWLGSPQVFACQCVLAG